MKKKGIFLLTFLIVMACVLLGWLFRPQPKVDLQALAGQDSEHSSSASNSESHPQSTNQSSPEEIRSITQDEFKAKFEQRVKDRAAAEERANDEWRTPIEFYGKVVDENNQPVLGATVVFGINDLSNEGYTELKKESDAQGRFSLTGVRGKHTSVTVFKDGYYTSARNRRGFTYAGENVNFVPDPNNPIVFHLRKRKIAEPLIAADIPGFAKIAQLPRTGEPVDLDLIKSTKATVGNGQLRLEFWCDKIEKTTKTFNWKLHISVPSGGLIGTDEEFNFEAPITGYKSPIEIEIPASTENWQGELRQKYFIQLADGNYGRFELYLLARNGVFTVQSFINPSGSRNLEYDETVQPK